MNLTTWAILLAAGKSEQLIGEVDTAYLNVGIKPVIAYSLEALDECPDIAGVVIVTDRTRFDICRIMAQRYGGSKLKAIVPGALERDANLAAAMKTLTEEVGFVVVHEVSRPSLDSASISKTVASARRYGTGISAVRITDIIHLTTRQGLSGTPLEAEQAWAVATPQAYKRDILEAGLDAARRKRRKLTDISDVLSLTRQEARLVEMPSGQIVIRSPDDLALAAALLK